MIFFSMITNLSKNLKIYLCGNAKQNMRFLMVNIKLLQNISAIRCLASVSLILSIICSFTDHIQEMSGKRVIASKFFTQTRFYLTKSAREILKVFIYVFKSSEIGALSFRRNLKKVS